MKTQMLKTGVATLMLGVGLWAGSVQARPDTAADAGNLPSAQHGVRYRDGGIGKDEAKAMGQHDKGYNLHLVFSEGAHKAYAADVQLRITDHAGKPVLALAHAGPLTDVKLPTGQYRVQGVFAGATRVENVSLKQGTPSSVYLHFPHDAAIASS